MGRLGSKCCHRTQMSRLTDVEMGTRAVPMETDGACSFACVALASDVWPHHPLRSRLQFN